MLSIPFCQKSPDSSAIRIGPPNSSAPLVPVIISYTPVIVNFKKLTICSDDFVIEEIKLNFFFTRVPLIPIIFFSTLTETDFTLSPLIKLISINLLLLEDITFCRSEKLFIFCLFTSIIVSPSLKPTLKADFSLSTKLILGMFSEYPK